MQGDVSIFLPLLSKQGDSQLILLRPVQAEGQSAYVSANKAINPAQRFWQLIHLTQG